MSGVLSPREILAKLISFPTVSRDTNLPLVDWVEEYLASQGIEAHRWMNQGGKSLGEAADRYNVSDSTMQRGLKRLGLFDAA